MVYLPLSLPSVNLGALTLYDMVSDLPLKLPHKDLEEREQGGKGRGIGIG